MTYLRYIALFTILNAAPVITVNYLVDPLWAFGGNKLNGLNLVWDERVAKLNQFARDPEEFDCVILGSSRLTLFDESRIRGSHCFNFSFSGGTVKEFLAFASYTATYESNVELLIVGVDGFNFFGRDSYVVPAAISGLHAVSWTQRVAHLLSFDVFVWSLRTLTGKPGGRYYDGELKAAAIDRPFRPNWAEALDPGTPVTGERFAETSIWQPLERSPSNIAVYQEIVALFPKARTIGLVAPLHLTNLFMMQRLGKLDWYLEAIWSVARSFDALYDFSIPSTITRNHRNTFDGNHFYPAVHRRIWDQIAADQLNDGVDVTRLSVEEYKGLVYARLAAHRASLAPEGTHSTVTVAP